MRGEDREREALLADAEGSPPHARGRPVHKDVEEASAGITPACAGKTNIQQEMTLLKEDHPRMRGEDHIPQ